MLQVETAGFAVRYMRSVTRKHRLRPKCSMGTFESRTSASGRPAPPVARDYAEAKGALEFVD